MNYFTHTVDRTRNTDANVYSTNERILFYA